MTGPRVAGNVEVFDSHEVDHGTHIEVVPHYGEPSVTGPWRCFHCNEVFSDTHSAEVHFGRSERQNPICTIDEAEYRAMERRMLRYNEEDSDLHRQIYGLQAKHTTELRREEEKGYARGLRDGLALATQTAPVTVPDQ